MRACLHLIATAIVLCLSAAEAKAGTVFLSSSGVIAAGSQVLDFDLPYLEAGDYRLTWSSATPVGLAYLFNNSTATINDFVEVPIEVAEMNGGCDPPREIIDNGAACYLFFAPSSDIVPETAQYDVSPGPGDNPSK